MPSARTPILISLIVIVGLVAALVWETGRAPQTANPSPNSTGRGEDPHSATAPTSGTLAKNSQDDQDAIFIYCAAGLKPPVEMAAKQYEQECGKRVLIQYGGSGTLLSNMRISKQGDLFLAADDTYINTARAQNLLDEAIPVANQHPVIAVAKGNPKKIGSVRDLLREDVKVTLANPDAASIGRQTQMMLEKVNLWTPVHDAATQRGVFKPTVNEVANDLKLKTADAGIVWDTTVLQYPELESIPIAEAASFASPITAGVLRSSTHPQGALHFARYLSARDKGLALFKKMGYTPAEGDAWEDQPQILYYSGAVNRVAIQETLKAFSEREGVHITTVFNGCGILLGQMKLGERPDVYHTCDASFMRGVEPFFEKPVPVSNMAIVILTTKGNPHHLRTLADLGQPGLKIALANEQQSSLGALTAEMLRRAGCYDQVQKNVQGTSPTGDLLVNQIRTGSLDAVVVYKSNTIVAAKFLDVIPLDLPGATATQTFAIGTGSRHKQLLARLFAALQRAESVKKYQESGFTWLLPSSQTAQAR